MHAPKSLMLILACLAAGPALAEIDFKPKAVVPDVAVEAPAPPAPLQAPVAPDPIEPLSPVLIVNGAAISGYELSQRAAFLKALQQTGDVRTEALRALTIDRLQLVAAAQMGLTISPEEVQAGMTEFAARAKLPLPDFLRAMQEAGVAPETFRDFVRSGLLWRLATREKFAGRVEVSEAEVDRAIGMGAAAGEGRRLLLSELVIPADAGRDVVALANRVRLAIKTEKDFAMMARQFSKAATAQAGGELGWLEEEVLPPDVKGALAGLRPGEVTQVLPLQGGAALYYLRDEGASAGAPGAGTEVVDYAVLTGGASSALAASIMGCDGLYPAARRGGQLTRDTAPQSSLPRDLAPVVAALDPGEARALPDGRLVMLCTRQATSGLPAARAAVRGDILNRKVTLLADGWLEELRFNAFIETP